MALWCWKNAQWVSCHIMRNIDGDSWERNSVSDTITIFEYLDSSIIIFRDIKLSLNPPGCENIPEDHAPAKTGRASVSAIDIPHCCCNQIWLISHIHSRRKHESDQEPVIFHPSWMVSSNSPLLSSRCSFLRRSPGTSGGLLAPLILSETNYVP